MQQVDVYSFMIQTRQVRINQNNQRISILLNELNRDVKYQKCLKLIELLEQKQTRTENQLKVQEKKYQENYKKRDMVSIGNQIQLIVETIAEKEEKIELISIMLEIMKENKINKISFFRKWYKRRKQIMQEELAEKSFIGTELIRFMKIYSSIRSKQKKVSIAITEQEKLQLLFDYYQMIKEGLVAKKEQKEEYFIERKNFIDSYFKLKNKSIIERQKINTQLNFLKPCLDNMLEGRKQKEQEIQTLEQLNQAYINQISNLEQMTVMEEQPCKQKVA